MEKLRRFMKEKIDQEGSQSAFARKTGVSQAGVNKIIHKGSQTVDMNTLQKIASAYNMNISFFVAEDAPEWHAQIMQDDRLSPATRLMAELIEEKMKGKTQEEREQLMEQFRKLWREIK